MEDEESDSGENAFRSEQRLPSSEGVRTIQRNRRGPMIRPNTSNSVNRFSRTRSNKARTGLKEKNNRINRDHESLIESLLRQPLESGPPSKEKLTFSHQTDRYGPPFGQDDTFNENFDATSLSPSNVFTVPFFSKSQKVQISRKHVALVRAMALFMSLIIVIIVVTITCKSTSLNSLGNKRLRHIEGAKVKLIQSNNTESIFDKGEIKDHMTQVEKRGWIISKDTTMDIGFATDDMVFDQSNRKDVKGEVFGLNDDQLDVSNYGNYTVSTIGKKEKINKNGNTVGTITATEKEPKINYSSFGKQESKETP